MKKHKEWKKTWWGKNCVFTLWKGKNCVFTLLTGKNCVFTFWNSKNTSFTSAPRKSYPREATGIYHASTTVLSGIDKVQARMQRIAGIDDLEALFNFNLAPLTTRRDIAMLGIIHRAVIGKGPVHLHKFFRRGEPTYAARTRLQFRRHDMQLVEYRNGDHTDYVKRSILGLVSVYNLLPSSAVHTNTVSVFQARLQDLVKERALAGCHDWAETFSPAIEWNQHLLMIARNWGLAK